MRLERRLRLPAVLGTAALALALVAGAALAPASTSSRGKRIFVADCASCHTLRDAKARGTVGPNLDRRFRHTSRRRIRSITLRAVRNGDEAMPAGIVAGADARAVADYVARVAGR